MLAPARARRAIDSRREGRDLESITTHRHRSLALRRPEPAVRLQVLPLETMSARQIALSHRSSLTGANRQDRNRGTASARADALVVSEKQPEFSSKQREGVDLRDVNVA